MGEGTGERSVGRNLEEIANPLRAIASGSFWEDGILHAGVPHSAKSQVPSTLQKLRRDAGSKTGAEMDNAQPRGTCLGRKDGPSRLGPGH